MRNFSVSIVIPAKNEELGLQKILPELMGIAGTRRWEVIVVNDGSTDSTSEICAAFGVKELVHPYSKGNGAAIKTGVRAASGDWVVCMDADGQHSPVDILPMLDLCDRGYDMVVGARSAQSQASIARGLANRFYNRLASYMTGHRVEDLTSGLRVFNTAKFKEFLSLLPNGFSYPTTSTMAFFRAGYSVTYHPITTKAREGASHINVLKDGLRFLLIIFKIGTLYSPLKLFIPVAVLIAASGIGWYGYTFFYMSRFTNMSALLLTGSVVVFMMGLLSEQITALMYKEGDK